MKTEDIVKASQPKNMDKKTVSSRQLNFYFFLSLAAIDFLFIGAAIHFYAERFHFWIYPFSYAGMISTFEFGFNNPLSRALYGTGMFLSGLLMLALAFYRRRTNPNRRNSFLLSLVTGAGFLIASFSPDDVSHSSHVIGSALVVATLWITATSYLLKLRPAISLRKYLILQAVLQLPIFACAITFFLNLGLVPNVLQKPALLALLFTLLYATF